ncbi:MAG: hypothetical protein Q9191_006919 [Dirinaria sp. TL-2023a]
MEEPLSGRENLESIRQQWRGIYWDAAKIKCEPADFEILAEATRMAVVITNYQTDMANEPFYNTPWHRFFVDDNAFSNSGVKGTWHGFFSDGRYRYINRITGGPKLGPSAISNANNYEGVIIHE